SRGVVVVADHDRILTDAATAGDELSMLARLLPGTVIVAAEQRRLACSRIRRHYPFVDVVLLDDGFQHRQLARDADIVLVDRDTVDRPFVMPRGVLREPLDGLRRASLVVTTPGVHEDEIRPFTTAPVVHVHTEVAGWVRYGTSSDGSPHAETALKPDRVVLITAIANAARVTSTCAEQGVTVMHHAEYRDHHAFTPQDVQKVMAHCRRTGCGTLLATEKDLPKLLPYLERLAASELELIVLRIRSVCSDPARVRDLLLETVRTWRRVHAKTTDDTSDART
ncbi:MAG: tetraacyldisaccharide 4'-kinase, partial [Candidatus Kapaibacterium sp.]